MSSLFASGSQRIRVSASASVLPMNIQDWFPLGWTGWITLLSKGLSGVFSSTRVLKHQFFSAWPLWSALAKWHTDSPVPWQFFFFFTFLKIWNAPTRLWCESRESGASLHTMRHSGWMLSAHRVPAGGLLGPVRLHERQRRSQCCGPRNIRLSGHMATGKHASFFFFQVN